MPLHQVADGVAKTEKREGRGKKNYLYHFHTHSTCPRHLSTCQQIGFFLLSASRWRMIFRHYSHANENVQETFYIRHTCKWCILIDQDLRYHRIYGMYYYILKLYLQYTSHHIHNIFRQHYTVKLFTFYLTQTTTSNWELFDIHETKSVKWVCQNPFTTINFLF